MKFKFHKSYIIPIVILAAGFVAMRILFSFAEEPEKRKPELKVRLAESVIVELSDIKSEVTAYGRLASSQPIVMTSEVTGVIERGDIFFQPGQSFKRNDLIVKIDDRQIKLDISSAKSDFLTALATVLPEIKIDFPEEYQKWQSYFDNCGFDKPLQQLPEPANQKIKLFLSRFNVYKLFFNVKSLEIRLEKHYFYAPFNGSVISAELREGAIARSGSRLGEIINLDDMELEVPIPVKDVDWIDESQEIMITSNEIDRTWKGKISRIGKTINTQTQTLQAFIRINRSVNDELYNGIFLKVAIPGKIIPDALTIPRKAVYNETDVYLVDNGKLTARKVNIARVENNHVIVNGGLEPGDTLVVEVLQGIAPGMPAEAILVDSEIVE
ncbi:MAG: efflux RND transporter periplasmic adaptor subunit [Melioribacteraceae bacterium]|nr:efflux RND transporter periplasmic adaptor subunit [Melioribacteraceae bacterium]